MEANNTGNGHVGTIISAGAAVVSIASVHQILSIIAALIAIVSGCFAIRYYIVSTNKLKNK